jgi:hypothetical protein
MMLEASSPYIDGKAGGVSLLLKPVDKTRYY